MNKKHLILLALAANAHVHGGAAKNSNNTVSVKDKFLNSKDCFMRVMGMLDPVSFVKVLAAIKRDRGDYIQAFSHKENRMVPCSRKAFPSEDRALFTQFLPLSKETKDNPLCNAIVIPNEDMEIGVLRATLASKIQELGDEAKPSKLTVLHPQKGPSDLFTQPLIDAITTLFADKVDVTFKCHDGEWEIKNVPNTVKSLAIKGMDKDETTLSVIWYPGLDETMPVMIQNAKNMTLKQGISLFSAKDSDPFIRSKGHEISAQGDTVCAADMQWDLCMPKIGFHGNIQVAKSHPDANYSLDIKANKAYLGHFGIKSAVIQPKDSDVPSNFVIHCVPQELTVSANSNDSEFISLTTTLGREYCKRTNIYKTAEGLKNKGVTFKLECTRRGGRVSCAEGRPQANQVEEVKE